MPTPRNAPYKKAQRAAEAASRRVQYLHVHALPNHLGMQPFRTPAIRNPNRHLPGEQHYMADPWFTRRGRRSPQ